MGALQASTASHESWLPRLGPLGLSLFAAICVFSAWIGHSPAPGIGRDLGLWMPMGFQLAVYLRSQRRNWPRIAVVAFASDLAGLSWFHGLGLAASSGLALGNSLAVLCGASWLRRGTANPYTVERPREILALALTGGLVCAAISAGGAALVTSTLGAGRPQSSWLLAWASQALSILVFTPQGISGLRMRSLWGALTPARRLEFGAALLTAASLAGLVFTGRIPVVMLVVPSLVWAAMRFGVGGASAVLALISILAVRLPGAGAPPFVRVPEAAIGSAAALLLTLALASLGALLLAAFGRERRSAIAALARVRDRLEERVAERTRALRASEERFRALFEQAAVGVAEVDSISSRILRVNRKYAELLGYSQSELLSFDFMRLTHRDDLSVNLDAMERLRNGETREFSLETRLARRDGSVLWVNLAVSALWAPGSVPTHHIAVITDLSLRKRAEQALLEADQRKNEYLAMLAHELRNPLAPIQNGLEILRLAKGDDEAARAARERMERQTRHLVRLVDDLLDVSRVTRGRIELRRERFPLADAVDDAVAAARPLIDAGQHELVVDLPREALVLDADPDRFVQVLTNLLNNAAKYSDAKGRIELGVERDGTQAVIRVSDRGVGIAPEWHERIFELFAQADPKSALRAPGLGIGLTLSRTIAEMHGGTLSAASEGVGHGSVFTLRLPLAGAAAQDWARMAPRS